MLNMILEITKGETSGNYERFINANYWGGLGLLQDLWSINHDLNEKEITFRDNGQELLIYTNLGTYACNYTTYCDIKFITTVYSKDGLVLEYNFDYDSPTSRCLLNLWELKNACPDRWIYQVDRIYDKYGIDTVNIVREFARY